MPIRSTSKSVYLWNGTTLSGTSQLNSSSINVANYTEATIYVKITAKGGTSPTLDLDVELSPDDSDWHKDADITQISNPTVTYYNAPVKVTSMGEYLRLTTPAGIGGSSSPTMTITAQVILKT